MPWYSYLFIVIAIVAMVGASLAASAGNTRRMAYAAIVAGIFSALIIWTRGYVG